MDEHLLAAVVGGKEAPSFGHVEPFAFAQSHTAAFLRRTRRICRIRWLKYKRKLEFGPQFDILSGNPFPQGFVIQMSHEPALERQLNISGSVFCVLAPFAARQVQLGLGSAPLHIPPILLPSTSPRPTPIEGRKQVSLLL